jgi:hypothetical protein
MLRLPGKKLVAVGDQFGKVFLSPEVDAEQSLSIRSTSAGGTIFIRAVHRAESGPAGEPHLLSHYASTDREESRRESTNLSSIGR